jgi:hypothetical protein
LKLMTHAGEVLSCASSSSTVGGDSEVIGMLGGSCGEVLGDLRRNVKKVAYVPTRACLFEESRGYNLRSL